MVGIAALITAGTTLLGTAVAIYLALRNHKLLNSTADAMRARMAQLESALTAGGTPIPPDPAVTH
jgi:hypothetical protein